MIVFFANKVGKGDAITRVFFSDYWGVEDVMRLFKLLQNIKINPMN